MSTSLCASFLLASDLCFSPLSDILLSYPLLLIKAVRYICLSVRTSVLFVFGAFRLIFRRDGLPNDGPVHKMPSTCAWALAGPAVTTVKLLSEWYLSWTVASPSKSFPNNFY
jgi:hypothetical protein